MHELKDRAAFFFFSFFFGGGRKEGDPGEFGWHQFSLRILQKICEGSSLILLLVFHVIPIALCGKLGYRVKGLGISIHTLACSTIRFYILKDTIYR